MKRMFEKGAFGNRLQTWGSVRELIDSSYEGLIGFRHRTQNQWPYASHPNIPALDAYWFLEHYNIEEKDIEISEGAPDQHQTIQGECYQSPSGLYVRYVASKLKMRPAMLLDSVKHVYNFEAHAVLRTYCWPASYDDILELMEQYDGATIEFTCFDRAVGNCRGRNPIIWEVRNF